VALDLLSYSPRQIPDSAGCRHVMRPVVVRSPISQEDDSNEEAIPRT
jgi:hypothetical protein